MTTADPTTADRPRLRIRNPLHTTGLASPGAVLATSWLAVVVIAAIVVPMLPGCDPLRADFANPSARPGPGHWFGTDSTGRDVLVRTAAGARASFAVAGLTVAVGLVVGGALGIASGWFGGWTDRVIGFATDLLMSVPALILVMIVVTLRGPGLLVIGGLIGLFTVPSFTRVTRAGALTLKERGFVQAARMIGTAPTRVLRREILPNIAPVALSFAFTATTVAMLSFLGFGLRPPAPSWGGIIAQGRITLGSAPWISLLPAAVLCLTVLALNHLGENLRLGSPKEPPR
ncbi:ABC transporter permease (plasmid) [Embleya sp. NBC_00888]|uniref:ABC transporter permease n=1 Tax=Embleya sp. NBC_00888 TaxID=2975960 RepID=UPI002F9170BD|nr:ABC transporter permease [Embleya sp. NBC_00888]